MELKAITSATSVAVSGDTVVVGDKLRETVPPPASNGDQKRQPRGHARGSGVRLRARHGGTWSQQAYLKASNTDARATCSAFSVSVSGDTLVIVARRTRESSQATRRERGPDRQQRRIAVPARRTSSCAHGATWSPAGLSQGLQHRAYYDGFRWLGRRCRATRWWSDRPARAAAPPASTATRSTTARTCSGAAYVFTRVGTIWSQQAYLKASNTDSYDRVWWLGVGVGGFGGGRCATGERSQRHWRQRQARLDNSAYSDSGAAYVFVPQTVRHGASRRTSRRPNPDAYG